MRVVAVLAGLILIVFCLLGFRSDKVVRFSEDPWPPYTFGEAGQAPDGGIAVDIITEMFRRIGVETEMTLFPWKRCLLQMQEGERDALMLLGYSKERESYLQYSDVIVDVSDLVFFRKSLPMKEWNSMEDFRSLTFARPHGFQFGEEFENAVKRYHIKVRPVYSDLQAFQNLADDRVDAFICNEITARTIFKKRPELRASCVAATKPFKKAPLYMAFSRKSPHRNLIGKVNEVIKEMKKDGSIDQIVDKYMK